MNVVSACLYLPPSKWGNWKIIRLFGPELREFPTYPYSLQPHPTPSHVSTRDHYATWEDRGGGLTIAPTMTWVCQGKCPAQQLHSSLPPCRACSTELSGSPFITLKNISLLQTLYISKLHLWKSCWSNFHAFGFPVVSLSISICIKGKLTPV